MWLVTFLQLFFNGFSLERKCGKMWQNDVHLDKFQSLLLCFLTKTHMYGQTTSILAVCGQIPWYCSSSSWLTVITSWETIQINSWQLENSPIRTLFLIPFSWTQMMFLEHQRKWFANTRIKLICTASLRRVLSLDFEAIVSSYWEQWNQLVTKACNFCSMYHFAKSLFLAC